MRLTEPRPLGSGNRPRQSTGDFEDHPLPNGRGFAGQNEQLLDSFLLEKNFVSSSFLPVNQ